jgi:hypothetical protein
MVRRPATRPNTPRLNLVHCQAGYRRRASLQLDKRGHVNGRPIEIPLRYRGRVTDLQALQRDDDLMEVDGHDMRPEPIEERRKALVAPGIAQEQGNA